MTEAIDLVSRRRLPVLERWLTLWVGLAMAVGVALGHAWPAALGKLAGLSIDEVNAPLAVLLWIMIVPMLVRIDLRALTRLRSHARGIGITLLINWGVKPLSMAFLAWLFLGHWFLPLLPPGQSGQYIAGLVLLAAAPCTAMVFVWSDLCGGEPHFTLSQVALNDLLMLVLFAPLVGALLGFSAVSVPWGTLALSVAVYLLVPLALAQGLRVALMARGGEPALAGFLAHSRGAGLLALVATLVLLFGFQGDTMVRHPGVIALISVPILIQVYFNAGLAFWLNRRFGVAYCVAGPSALIGASNFFELAVATAIGLFGFRSGAALATVVGVLVEVPVMLSVVSFVRKAGPWYARANAAGSEPGS